MNFDKDSIKPVVKEFILKNYLGKEEWDQKRINNASKAAGPLAQWLQSIVEYADIFERIQPLRNKVIELEQEHTEMKNEMTKLENIIIELEQNIEQYKLDYG
jgi:dynein heavy chain 1